MIYVVICVCLSKKSLQSIRFGPNLGMFNLELNSNISRSTPIGHRHSKTFAQNGTESFSQTTFAKNSTKLTSKLVLDLAEILILGEFLAREAFYEGSV